MADNMIELIASLDTDKSVSQIQKDLDGVAPNLNLEVVCGINTRKTADRIQGQLNKIASGIKLDFTGIGGGRVDKIIDEKAIKSQADALVEAFDLEIPRGKTKEVRDVLQGLLNDYNKAFQSNNFDAMTKSFQALEDYVSGFRKEIVEVNKDLLETQQKVRDLARAGKTYISEQDYIDLALSLGGTKQKNGKLTAESRRRTDSVLGQVFGGINGVAWSTTELGTTSSWDRKSAELNALFNQNTEYNSGRFKNDITGVAEVLDYLNEKYERTIQNEQEFNNEQEVFNNNLRQTVNTLLGIESAGVDEGGWFDIITDDELQDIDQAAQYTQNLKTAFDEAAESQRKLLDISAGGTSKEISSRAKNVLNDYFKNSYTEDDLERSVTRVKFATEDAYGELGRFTVQVERSDDAIETLTYSLNEETKMYEYLGKTIREADNATDMRKKDIGTQWDIQTQKLQQFIANAEKAGIASTLLEDDIKDLNDMVAERQPDTGAMNTFLDRFDIAKSKLQAFNAEARKQNFLDGLSNRIKKLSADMNAFAVSNERAVKSTRTMSSGKTFAQEWQELSDTLSKGNLSDNELKRLRERFAIFGKEAESAGLKGKSAWEKFLNTFKTFSSYITANMVFNTVKREISKMVQEVVNLDTSMTELRKVTEATDEEFNKFLETAKQSAQYLGSSVTDLVDATSTFSRLGYSLSEAQTLGEIATLYKNVGDGIDISTASESMVSTLKAFKIEAEDAISIVDKFNEVGNNFAISSGGIGEALLRSASALAAANNDLSQSIALITTANTIAQNPEMVGTGLKTMALRLRSTKTEIEEMGEDAEGAAENVSKLRDQVLALTKNKVDIQLDPDTYKSSYQILLEISKVWDELNDISQASLLEQLFGKRQANVGAAILENGDLLQEVYKTAEESIGSATKEQEKFAKSIQYSVNSFKAAYQSMASDLVQSSFVKAVVDFGSTVIKGLDFIITKTGVLQGILVGFGSLAIFKTIPVLITKIKTLGASLAAFSSIINTLNMTGNGKAVMTTNQLAAASKLLSNRQFELILSTQSLTTAQIEAMMAARGFTQEQIAAQIAVRNQTLSTAGLAASEGAATAATFSLSGAIKGLGVAIAANPIGLIVTTVTLLVTALTSLKRKREEAIVEAKRLEEERQQNLETTINELKSFENEQDAIDDLTERYVSLYNTTSNIASKKDELVDITEQLNEKFGDEKTQIDLVNKSLSENIELIREQQVELDRQWQRDNKDIINEARKYAAENSTITVAEYKVSELDTDYEQGVNEAKFAFNKLKDLIDQNNKDLWRYLDVVEEEVVTDAGYLATTYALKLKEGVNEEVIPEVLKSFRTISEKLYDEYAYIDFDWIEIAKDDETLNQYISDWEKYGEILAKDNAINNELWDNNAASMDGSIERFNELANAASEASRKMNAEDALPADVYMYSRQIEEIRLELEELAKTSPELQKRYELIFSSIGLVSEDVSESADLLKKTFFEALDEMQKGVFDKVDKINEAITKMMSGETLSSAEAWELLDMDLTGILNPVIDANGEWIIQSEELIALKERLLSVSRQQVQADLDSAQKQVTQLDKEINEQYGIIKTQEEIIAQQAHGNTKPNEDNVRLLSQAKSKVNELLAAQKKYSEEVKRDKLLLQELNDQLRLSVEQAQKVADAYAKAYLGKIDKIIDGLEDELDTLDDQKDALNDQLDILESQQDELEDMISKYKDIAGIIEDEINKEIDSLKEQQKAQEDAYNARIDALKQENEEREDALEYAQKLANLENAKNNKVRVIDETRGFRYESIKEDVVKAENDLADFESEQAIKALEKERDAASETFDAQIKEYEDYLEQFKEIQEEETNAENERIMTEEMGSDWREQIKNKDTAILIKYQNSFKTYNSQLNNLVNNEIASLKKSITAKEDEIKTKKKQIETWKDYKTTVEDAIKNVDEKYDEYIKKLNDVNLAEDNRETSLQTFVGTYEGYVQQIQTLQSQLQDKTVGLYVDSNIKQLSGDLADFILNYGEAVSAMAEKMANADVGMGLINSDWDYQLVKAANALKAIRGSDAAGGVNSETGLYMLHGEKQRAEVTFNAKQARTLFEMVKSNNFANMVAEKALVGFANAANLKRGGASNSSVSIGSINVYANNPTELAKGLDKQLDKYFQTKLTANYTHS